MSSDELAPRRKQRADERFESVVDDLEALMRSCLKPQFEGYGGQITLSRERTEAFESVNEGRKALRAAGKRLGWKVRTYYEQDGGRLHAFDVRERPEHVSRAMSRHAAKAIDGFFRGHSQD
ncbi:hypothetical protein [Actinomadura fibrosa]|uniref:HK97 gp10 family phage protein n=1 Tax=Actinomadura fibrosa TaxID=111802 RepID=A0ABW2Y170_9ACTN|nr:hypothetical protein [Actinomadura fibrosa]